jgi:hypothetical protein
VFAKIYKMITVRLPNDDRVTIEYNEELTCQKLFELISSSNPKNYINPVRGKLLKSQGEEIPVTNPSQILSEYGIGPGSYLEILENFEPIFHPTELSYDSFIAVSTPLNGEENISIDKQPTIYFRENNHGLAIYLPCLINRDALRSDTSGDMVEMLGSVDEAKRRGFVQWTDKMYNQFIFLLEVTNPKLEKMIDEVRYNYGGINEGYDQGDRHSWQRYTEKLPIDCFVHLDELENKIRLVPELRLTPGGTYCLLFQHGIPTPPAEDLLSSLFTYTGKGICEDKVIFFRTQKSKPARASMFG